MLSELSIKKFAIIEDIQIGFNSGLSVLTGETGAGKSIIIEAVNLLLGSRASSDLVRTGEETAELEAFFDIETGSGAARLLEEQGMDASEGLMVRRLVSRTGKSRVFINSRQSTLDFLKQVTRDLAGVASQHAHQGLLREENHLDILDEYADTLELRHEVGALHRRIQPLTRRIREFEAEQARKNEEQDLLEFQVAEIETAAIRPGEDETLEKKRQRLMNAAKIFETVNGAVHEIYDREGSVIEKMSRLQSDMDRFGSSDDDLARVAEGLNAVIYDIQDLVEQLRDYGARIDLDPSSLASVEERLDLISRLKRKYGGSLESLFAEYEAMQAQLDRTVGIGREIREMAEEKKRLEAQIRQKAKALSMRRKNAAVSLAKKAKTELGALEMGKARFEIDFTTTPADRAEDIRTDTGEKISGTGADRVCFLLSPNPGEAAKPLAKIASGGELSRIVLALKAVLSGNQSFETLIFDEVDAGIGGATSEKVGLKLRALADGHQVICITHLAQIAKYGQSQYRISKQVKNGRTCTDIVPLNSLDERVEEIARMIGGSKITDATRTHARELLMESQ